jgi:hypothetical protein
MAFDPPQEQYWIFNSLINLILDIGRQKLSIYIPR